MQIIEFNVSKRVLKVRIFGDLTNKISAYEVATIWSREISWKQLSL